MATADTTADTAELVDERDAAVHGIIRSHALYAAASGLIPLPVLDLAATTTIQLRMMAKLCDAYGLPFSQQAVKSAISALIAAGLPRATVGYPTISLVKGVPVVGPLLGIATLPAYNAVVTWAVGKVFAWHFANGGELGDMDAKAMAGRFGDALKAGKDELVGASGDAKKK